MFFLNRVIKAIFVRLKYYIKAIYYFVIPIKFALNKKQRDFSITVSLTSFTPRLKTLHLCIKTLMIQSLKPDRIILYLGTDVKQNELPFSLKKLEKFGLTIKTNCENLRPHKKYFFAMQEYPNDFIITVDDDLLYKKNLIKDLWNTHLIYPEAVCARRVHIMTKENGLVKPYNFWQHESSTETKPSHKVFSTNGAGSLFPPNCIQKKYFDIKLIKELCLNADDIWIKFMLLLSDTKVVWTGDFAFMPEEIRIARAKKCALMDKNVTENQNDTYIKTLQSYFSINLADFC